jgi:hypothetical protein
MSGHSEAHSSKSIYTILVSTFVFGFLVGGIIFLQNNTGKEGDGALSTNTRGFEILAYSYGGCARLGCAAYKLVSNGSYTFMLRGIESTDAKFEGKLDSDTLKDLKSELEDTSFTKLKGTKFNGTCAVQTDGVAFRYEITYKNERHDFDSCAESIDREALFKILKEFFTEFQSAEQSTLTS